MLTGRELIHALLVPVLVAGLLAAIGRWRQWPWAMPVAAGAGFLAGYGLLGLPDLPPRDGTDWLFWLTIPLAFLGVVEARFSQRWTWLFGAVAGLIALVLLLPLMRVGSVPTASAWTTIFVLAAVAAGVVLMLRYAIDRLGPVATLAGLCIVVGGAGVIVMSSNLRIVGIYGLAAAGALAPVALLSQDPRAPRGVSLFATALLTGLLVAGRYYPDPGVSWTHFILVLAAPLLLPLVALVPMKRHGLRAVIAVAAVAVVIGAIVVPNAIAAKKAAESDPYETYR